MDVLVVLGFLGVVLAVAGGIHYYLWRRLIRDTTAKGTRARRLGTVAAIVPAAGIPITLIGTRAGAAWLAWGYLWLAMMFYLLVTLLMLEVPMLLARLWLRQRARRTAAPVVARSV